MQAWHVATVKPSCEMLAALHLQRQGFTPFNPRYRTRKIVRGEEITRTRPFLPGYIFIPFDHETEKWKCINGTMGIKSLIYSSEETPARVPDAAIGLIVEQCDGEGFVKKFEAEQALAAVIRKDDLVRVREGLFKDFVAPVHWSDGQRVKVMMTIFGMDKAVEFKKGALEKVA